MAGEQKAFVRLNFPSFAASLSLSRTPTYLRFVRNRDGVWDALDQLDDEPREGEMIVAAKLAYRGSVHIDGRDKNGRRFGKWEVTADYEPVSGQPTQAALRDTATWRAWCEEQLAKEPKPQTAAEAP